MEVKKAVLAIDPGSPKKKDKSAITGWVIGDLYKDELFDGGSIEINSKDRDIEERACVSTLAGIVRKYQQMGYEVKVVIEEYLNYSAQGFGVRNSTSELIGMIRQEIGGSMQSTSQMKTMFSHNALEQQGLIYKKGNKWIIKDLEHKPITRHVIDAYKHYLLYKKKRGIWTTNGGDIYDLI